MDIQWREKIIEIVGKGQERIEDVVFSAQFMPIVRQRVQQRIGRQCVSDDDSEWYEVMDQVGQGMVREVRVRRQVQRIMSR